MKTKLLILVLYIIFGVVLTELSDVQNSGMPYFAGVIFLPLIATFYWLIMLCGAIMLFLGQLF